MAIQLNDLILNKKDFSYGNKTVTAEYTPELDKEFGNVTLRLADVMKKVNADDVENADLATQQQVLSDVYDEVVAIASDYIVALFGEEAGNDIIERAGRRAPVLMNLATRFHQAGQDNDIEKEQGRNRDERRKG